jgi:hypothetical protein
VDAGEGRQVRKGRKAWQKWLWAASTTIEDVQAVIAAVQDLGQGGEAH